jgi:membrane-associated phospholipid phosphatase
LSQLIRNINDRAATSSTPKMRVVMQPFAPVLRMFASVDLLVVAYAILMILIALFGSARVPEWSWVVAASVFSILAVYGMNIVRLRNKSKWVDLFHLFYLAPVIPIFFKLSEKMSFVLHGRDYDDQLIMVDRLLFHTDPTVWLFTHVPPSPAFVDLLQVCYALFYFLPILLAIELYRRHHHESAEHQFGVKPKDQLTELRFVIVYGFFLSYLGYLLYPAIGPRFTLHDFANLGKDLPGGFFTDTMRRILDAGENIDPLAPLSVIRQQVTRDAFPSGHTDMTFITILLAFKYKAKVKWVILAIGTVLIFSTVYLRYHYVIDLVGGVTFGLITLYSWQWMDKILRAGRRKILHGTHD